LTNKIIGKKVFKHGHCMDKYFGNLEFKRPTVNTTVIVVASTPKTALPKTFVSISVILL